MAADVGISVQVDFSLMDAAFARISRAVEELVVDALDDCSALVQQSARAGHPKVADRIQGAKAVPYRQKTPSGSGEFSGMYRYLTRTGNLSTSIQKEPARRMDGGYESGVFSGMEYSDRLEYGGYPFMRPALETNRHEITKRIASAVKRGIG